MSAAIKTALERNAKAVSLRPSVGQGTAITRTRLRDGLTCDIEEGSWKLVAGMTEKYGGTGEAPNPGVLGRAALGSCLTIGIAMCAARLGVPLDLLEVEIQADYDVRGELGVADEIRPGYSQVRYIVTVSSPASEDEVRRMIETSEKYSSWRDIIANPTPMQRELRITSSARA